jgi:hypothetical protein
MLRLKNTILFLENSKSYLRRPKEKIASYAYDRLKVASVNKRRFNTYKLGGKLGYKERCVSRRHEQPGNAASFHVACT